jgi:hypothetical protein
MGTGNGGNLYACMLASGSEALAFFTAQSGLSLRQAITKIKVHE